MAADPIKTPPPGHLFPIVSDYVKVAGSRWVWRVDGVWSVGPKWVSWHERKPPTVPTDYSVHLAGLGFIKRRVKQSEIVEILP